MDDEDESNLVDNNLTSLSSRSPDGHRRTTCEISHQLFQQYIDADAGPSVTIDNLVNRHRMFTLMRIRELKRQLDNCLQSLAQLRQVNHQLQQQNENRLAQLSSNRSKIACRG